MKENIVLFDIDNTLIDTKKLSSLAYKNIAAQTGLTLEEIVGFKDEYKDGLEANTDFYPNNLIDFLEEKTSQTIDNPFEKKEIYLESLFEETIDSLKELQKTNKLGTYSEGFTDYQRKKLESAGIIDFFDKDLIFVKRRKLNDDCLKEIPNGAILVDDNPKVVEKMKKNENIKLFWLNRKTDETIKGIKTIKKLNELLVQ